VAAVSIKMPQLGKLFVGPKLKQNLPNIKEECWPFDCKVRQCHVI